MLWKGVDLTGEHINVFLCGDDECRISCIVSRGSRLCNQVMVALRGTMMQNCGDRAMRSERQCEGVLSSNSMSLHSEVMAQPSTLYRPSAESYVSHTTSSPHAPAQDLHFEL